jgi:hypothetical protein
MKQHIIIELVEPGKVRWDTYLMAWWLRMIGYEVKIIVEPER